MKERKAKIVEFKTEVLYTQIKGKNKEEVKTEPKNEPIVEKNKSFQIFSQVLFHFKISESRGIVCDAKKTGKKKSKNELIKIDKK